MKTFLIVLDGIGVGALPDSESYNGISHCDTLGHLLEEFPDAALPNLRRLGMNALFGGTSTAEAGAVGKAMPLCPANDSAPLHWEMAGILLDKPFALFPDGLPAVVMSELQRRTGYRFIGNRMVTASEQLEGLWQEHMETGQPAIYATNDSVVQIVACPEVIPVEQLYRICGVARELLVGEFAAGRVVAKPFRKTEDGFLRLGEYRRDYALPPPVDEGLLVGLRDAGHRVTGVGKINAFFQGVGLTENIMTADNEAGIAYLLERAAEDAPGFTFCNLIDFDNAGHANDPDWDIWLLEDFDRGLGSLLDLLADDDLLIITADHGCDPTISEVKTHTREYVLVLAWRRGIGVIDLGTRRSLADVGATIAEAYKLELKVGTSFLGSLQP